MVNGRGLLLLIFQFLVSNLLAQQVDKNYLLGHFEPDCDARFEKIPALYSAGAGIGGYLRKETLEAFSKMHEAAKKDGITLTIVSATRNFARQKSIWESKWTGKTLVEGKDLSQGKDSIERAKIIMRFSSMPGTSRHHWGTDIDINSVEDSYFETPEGRKVYQWLTVNAPRFGFCQPYTSKIATRRTGYEEEKWHWSYLPVSSQLLKKYNEIIDVKDLIGFKGCSVTEVVQAVTIYVNGISCK